MKKELVLSFICMFGLESLAQTPILNNDNSVKSSTQSVIIQNHGVMMPRYSYLELSYNNLTFDSDGSENDDYKGFSAAYISGKKVSQANSVFMEYGLGMDYIGYSDKISGVNLDEKILAINVPVRFVYDLPVDNFHVCPFAGLGAKCNVSGIIKGSYNGKSYKYDMFDEDDVSNPMNRLQAYFSIGATVKFNNFIVGVEYDKDLSEIAEESIFTAVRFKVGLSF